MFVLANADGVIRLPDELREGLPPDGLFKAVKRDDGVIELHPQYAVGDTEIWVPTPEQLAMEREADEDIAAGRVEHFDSFEAFIARLEQIDREQTERERANREV